MGRFIKKVFGRVLVLAMVLAVFPVTAAYADSASVSIEVSGQIGGTSAVVQYHITYDANGGAGSYQGPDVDSGATDWVCALSDTGITRSGYTFTGWNSEADGTGTSYAPGDYVTLVSDMTLYAQWKKEAVVTQSGPVINKGSTMSSSAVKTGDTNGLTLWISLLGVSLLGLAVLPRQQVRRKKKKQFQEF